MSISNDTNQVNMPTYTYYCEVHNEFEEEHSINLVLEECPRCKNDGLKPQKVKRLISKGSSFILNGGGWANSGYS
jgi:putative FmdB family regulatory protein